MIKFSTGQCVKEVLCDITPTNSCHLLLRWAWLNFKMLNLDEGSLWGMRDMKWSSNLWHQDKPVRINIGWREKYKRRNINYRRKRNWRKRKGKKDKDDGKGSRKTRCLIEGHPCLVAFVCQSDNNVLSQRLVEKL